MLLGFAHSIRGDEGRADFRALREKMESIRFLETLIFFPDRDL